MHRPVRQKGLLALALMAGAAIPASAADIALVIDNQSSQFQSGDGSFGWLGDGGIRRHLPRRFPRQLGGGILRCGRAD